METAIAAVIILTVVLFGVLTIIQGHLSSQDAILESWRKMEARLEERAGTDISPIRANTMGVGDIMEVTLRNEGDTKLADFDRWDVIVQYYTSSGAYLIKWLPYTDAASPGDNQWTVAGIYLDASVATPEIYQPGILNPGEEVKIHMKLQPAVDMETACWATIDTSNGVVAKVMSKALATYFLHSETSSIGGTDYYQLKEDTTADGPATTISSVFSPGQTGRVRPASNNGKFVYPLTGVAEILASTWAVTYRVKRDKVDTGFVWFTNADDISLSTTGSWQDIDVSPYLPVGATGAIVEVVNTGTSSSYTAVVRGKEDTRDYMSNPAFEEIEAETHRWQIVKVDSNRLIQGYIEHIDIDFKLLGYTIGSDPAFFTTPPDITPGTTGSWTPVDVSGYVDIDADGVILFIDSIDSTDRAYGIREVGSSYSTTNRELEEYGNTMYLVGINASDQFDAYIENANVKIYLEGQSKGSVVYYTDDIPVLDPPTGSYQELDADDYSVSGDANGLIFLAQNALGGIPQTVTLQVTDGWDESLQKLLSDDGKVYVVQTSDDDRWTVSTGSFTSFEFDQNVPAGSIIQSVKVYVEHHEEGGITPNSIVWEVGTGSLQSPTVLGSTNPTILEGEESEATVEWDVTTWIDTPGKANDLKVVVRNNDSSKKSMIDHVYVEVTYSLSIDAKINVRHGASTDDWNGDIGADTHFQAAIGLRDDNVWDEYMENTCVDLFIAAYTRLVRMDVHADMDVLIRKADGTIRTTLATNVADTINSTDTTWQSFIGTYVFPGYTVVDQTDYLEIDLFAEATSNTSGETVLVDFRIDDPSLPWDDQTRVQGVDLP